MGRKLWGLVRKEVDFDINERDDVFFFGSDSYVREHDGRLKE